MKQEYYKTKETVEEYIRLAKDVNGRDLIEKLQKFLPRESTLLEIGSGPGTDWKILSEWFGVVGSDNSEAFLNHLKSAYPEGSFLLLDAVSLETELFFDGIYANKVMHHLNDLELEQSIKRQSEILKSGGIICHSFWKGEGSEVFKGLFVNYHQRADLEKYYSTYFQILSIEPYAEFEAGDSLLLLARKK